MTLADMTSQKEIGAQGHWLHVRRLPLLLVLGGTVTAFGLFWYRKGRYDPTFLTEDSTRKGGFGEAELTKEEYDKRVDAYEAKKFGKKSAERSGLMEGDRPMEGIYSHHKK